MRGLFEGLAGLKVLIADDEDGLLALWMSVIPRCVADAVVITAKDGAEAVARAMSCRPDVIVMDLAMPIVDGITATRALKAAVETADIPVIAFTGKEWDKEKVMAAGCAAFLAKPCSPQKLLSTVAEVLETRGVQAQG